MTYVSLLQEWWPWLREEGFEPLPHLHQWRRNTDFGFQCVILSLLDLPDSEEKYIEVHCGLRFTQVEQLSSPFTSTSASYRPNSMTLVAPLGKIGGSKPLRLLLQTDNQPELQHSLGTRLRSEGLEFFRHYDSLSALDDLLNSTPEKPTLLIPNALHRPFRAMAAAHLMQRKDLAQLGQVYWRWLKQQATAPYQVERFERFNAYLQGVVQLN